MSAITLPQTNGVVYCLIYDWPGYCVGDDGSVWSCRSSGWIGGLSATWHRVNTRAKNKYGHQRVLLCNGGYRKCVAVHRLVLAAFVGACPEGMECCHLNGNARDNRLVNLCWGTRSRNSEDTRRHGTNPLGQRNPHAILTDELVREIKRLKAEGHVNQRQIARRMGVTDAAISAITRGVNWSHIQL